MYDGIQRGREVKKRVLFQNIVLDMGNVLLNFDPEIPLRTCVDTEENRAVIRRELFEGPEWTLRDLGEISEQEMYEQICARIPGKLHGMLRRCVYEWTDCMTPIPAAQEFCAYVKERGCRIYVLSNASDNFYQYFPRFSEPEYFDGIVVSYEIHKIKPEPEIYRYLLERYRLEPAKTLFIDDRPENVKGAVSVGMRGYVYRNDFEEIKDLIQNKNICHQQDP